MLRLSSDSLHISFSPAGFKLEKRQGYWHQKLVDVALVRTRSGSAPQSWQGSLQALQSTLADERWQDMPMNITVSDRLLRYQLVPSLPELATPKERLAYAEFQFRQTYGSMVDQWDIRVDAAFPDSPAIACGLEKGLSEGLLGLGQFSKGTVRSITPRFVATINRGLDSLRSVEEQRFVVCLFEAGGITSGLVEGGQWRSIRQRFITSSPISSLCNILEQERLASPVQHESTKVLMLNWPELSEEDVGKVDPRWQLFRFDLPNPLPDLGA